jgi:hypothetical protein
VKDLRSDRQRQRDDARKHVKPNVVIRCRDRRRRSETHDLNRRLIDVPFSSVLARACDRSRRECERTIVSVDPIKIKTDPSHRDAFSFRNQETLPGGSCVHGQSG